MLEKEMIEQLRSVFGVLEGNIELAIAKSSHEKQQELIEMLSDVASASDKIDVASSEIESSAPFFEIKRNGEKSGISFSGIPGGHEFTSLILAILNADQKGKLPDDGIIERIKNIKGPINLKTFISLSCENCPEVVQALNLMAVFNPDISNEMVDGAFFQDEIDKLNIQGVPSVVSGDTLICSGKTDLLELITNLEKHFGVDENRIKEPVDLGMFDVAVIGGGPAGASASIYSARKGLKTAIIAEKTGGQVKETKGIENLISIPYTEGPELAEKISAHISEYDIKVIEHRRVKDVAFGDLKEVHMDSGEFIKAKSVIIATGAKWRELNVPGEKEYLGRGVAFCPHCDGPFYKGKEIAVIGGGNSGVEAAIDLAGIVKKVTVFEFLPELKADRVLVEKLETLENVTVLKNVEVKEVVGDGEKVTGLKYNDLETGNLKSYDLAGIFVQIGLLPNSDFIEGKIKTNQFGEIMVDKKCRTSEKDVYAAGDVTNVPYKQIVISMGEGAKAALTAFEEQVLQKSDPLENLENVHLNTT